MVDPTGDRFGNYHDYNDNDIVMTWTGNETHGGPAEGDSGESDDEDLDAANAEQESGLEPERPNHSVNDSTIEDADPHSTDDATTRSSPLGRQGEEALRRKPFIVKFPRPGAGHAYTQHSLGTNDLYMKDLQTGDPNSIYAPFLSKLEWEIAQWAKLRGLSSTAFTDLMKIDGVSVNRFQEAPSIMR